MLLGPSSSFADGIYSKVLSNLLHILQIILSLEPLEFSNLA